MTTKKFLIVILAAMILLPIYLSLPEWVAYKIIGCFCSGWCMGIVAYKLADIVCEKWSKH